MDKTNKWLMGIAAISTIAFLYRNGKEKGMSGLNHVDGINIEINPEKLVGHARKKLSNLTPGQQDLIVSAAQSLVRNYVGELRSDADLDDDDDEYDDNSDDNNTFEV